MKKMVLKIVLGVVGVLLLLIAIVFVAFQVSPRTGALLISRQFNQPVKITDQKAYDLAEKKVSIVSDETFKSKHSDHTFDIYYPKNSTKAVPVLVWAHGGGFVAGDKSGTKEFATRIVADANIAVVSMNYEVAPSSQYPNQVIQVGELINQLQETKYKMLDLSKLFFGGDSAGGQIALQYATAQTNPSYAKEIGVEKRLDDTAIKGAISYCAPVDLQQMASQKTDNKFMKFFIKTVAWSLIGTKKWQEDPRLFQASLVENVTAAFPPTYITDGNAYSFQDQGLALENKLKTLGVSVEGLFYKGDKKEITHEYQFNYHTEEAKKCYEQTLAFVRTYK
ncbi:alpha/beta hydrolase [Enterococcus faecalis]|uniref:alpha/beta hydrolase n=1 Tax=Enterococcus faecalis TaxID=1351 RepID=UPI003CC56938